MIRHILWDFDGTLFDTYPAFAQAYSAALKNLGAPPQPMERLAELARESLEGAGKVLAKENNLDVQAVLEVFHSAYAAIPPEMQPLFPYAREVCQHIVDCGGLNLLATHRGRVSTYRFLQAYDLLNLFTECVTHDEGFPAKPDPAMFEALIQNHSLPRDHTLAVGDRDLDLQAGAAAGIQTCAFGQGPFGLPADYHILGFQELLLLLTKG